MDDSPRYRIQAVSQMTGVPSPTLRAWERRYGVPAPGRTARGYRLYSPQDIEQVTRMRDLLDSGMSASEAARMVDDSTPEPPQDQPGALDDPYDTVCKRLVDAVQRFDSDGLDDQVRRALTLGPATQIFERCFSPALVEIGDAWHRGELSVGQEHMASQAIGTASRMLLNLVQPTAAPRTALLACFADEAHDLPLLGVAFRLASWGYRCVVLGARTPPEALGHAVAELQPDLVGLSLTVAPPAARFDELVRDYAGAVGDTPWVVGGLGSQAHVEQLQASGAIVFTGDPEALRRSLATP